MAHFIDGHGHVQAQIGLPPLAIQGQPGGKSSIVCGTLGDSSRDALVLSACSIQAASLSASLFLSASLSLSLSPPFTSFLLRSSHRITQELNWDLIEG